MVKKSGNDTLLRIIELDREVIIVSSIYRVYQGIYRKTIAVSIFTVSNICPQ